VTATANAANAIPAAFATRFTTRENRQRRPGSADGTSVVVTNPLSG
jgi:hypothetical protein